MCGALGNPSHRVLSPKEKSFYRDSMCKLRGSAEPHCQLDSDSKSWKTGDNSDKEGGLAWRHTNRQKGENAKCEDLCVVYQHP